MKHQDVSKILEAFLDSLVDHLGQGKVVALRDFGTFDLRVFRQKVGRNPKRPDVPIIIPDRHVIRFRPGGKLEALVASVPVAEGEQNHEHAPA
jgi:nucleoid DNA-binding protein